MIKTLVNAWRLPDLRKKLLFTMFWLIIFQLGTVIPVPGIAKDALKNLMGIGSGSGTVFDLVNIISGGAMQNASIFAMSITPYVNSSIIIQLLTVAIPSLEKIAQEGMEGRKLLAKWTRYLTVILAFIQASGKVTQSGFLKEFYGIPSISTGSIIRQEISASSVFGNKAKSYIDNGELVPDDLILEMVKQRLAMDDCKNGYILDGFPRTVVQAEFAETHGIEIEKALLINVSDEEVIHRITGRRECKSCGAVFHTVNNPPKQENSCDKCGAELYRREDDTEETVRKRLSVYHKQTEPLVAFYKKLGKLISIDGTGDVDMIKEKIFKALGENYGNN